MSFSAKALSESWNNESENIWSCFIEEPCSTVVSSQGETSKVFREHISSSPPPVWYEDENAVQGKLGNKDLEVMKQHWEPEGF